MSFRLLPATHTLKRLLIEADLIKHKELNILGKVQEGSIDPILNGRITQNYISDITGYYDYCSSKYGILYTNKTDYVLKSGCNSFLIKLKLEELGSDYFHFHTKIMSCYKK